MKVLGNKKYADSLALVVGGGAAIDRAKIWAKKHKKYLIAIPITGSGASETSHAVVWGKTKKNVDCPKPTGVLPPFKVSMPWEVRRNTCLDMIGHLVDYLNVCTDNEVVEAGMYMGSLIERHPTNLTHPMSYPLTLKGMPHGEAVGRVLKHALEVAFPLNGRKPVRRPRPKTR